MISKDTTQLYDPDCSTCAHQVERHSIAYNVLHYRHNKEVRREGLVTEAQKRAKAKYDLKTVQYVFRFRMGADADIIERLKSVPAKTDYIRKLIREDMARGA